MQTVNIHQAKTHLSKLVDQAAKGKPFVIAKAGKPLVKIVALNVSLKPERLGFLADAGFCVPDDFDTLGRDEIIRQFHGEP
ncbi:MAG: type II toxin-antitoxin system prevent-host-death family antitoxin [Rhodanobacter sp.]|jgi:prevent-host-death family protein|nr:type II toxin-antitoxin system prevent-host-death family antitoxin [Rhodanobacter sp.]